MSELEWGVEWEVATPPQELLPTQPVPPTPPADPEDQAAAEAYAQAQQEYRVAVDMAYHELENLLANPEYWNVTVATFADEAAARSMLPQLISANASSPFTRNFRVVSSPPRVWTPA